MRRPDLPLILVVVAMGVALATFADGSAPAPEDGASPPSTNPAQAYLGDVGLAIGRCLRGERPPREAGGQPPASARRLVATVSRQIERVRELRFRAPVAARFLAPAAIRERISSLIREELPPGALEPEEDVLELLGAIPPATDLLELEERALGSQVSGLYDPETQELLVRSSGEVGVLEQITLAHELEHALADQSFGLRSPQPGRPSVDRDLAYIAVVEGDATLTMEHYALAHIGLEEQLEGIEEETLPNAARRFERLPDYVQRSLVFPYFAGLRIVCARWLAGGWEAVDRLYAKPPEATDEILFPGRYGDGPPADPRDPGAPGGRWQRAAGRELGAAELEWLFTAPGGRPAAALPQSRRLVAAWAGGELELWKRGDDRALGISLVERSDADLLCGALAAWYRAAFPTSESEREEGEGEAISFREPSRWAHLSCRADEVRLGIAPDEAAARRLAG